MSRRKTRGLRPEERELWQKVARTAAPLHPERRAPAPEEPKAGPPMQHSASPPEPVRPFRVGETASSTSGPDLAPRLSEQLSRDALQMDRKAFTRMKRGKLGVEGRLDLHGMTLAQAHPRLNEFILSAHAQGKRLVLVITGKGKSKGNDGPIPERRGLLKHQVPQWLRSGPLRAAVLQISEAHQSHGGSGAYYVYLRRRR
ncbi:Smr/MutS family protein [Tranquillimonas alkanivorans]|uniref:DNA-nicking endonuclease, Smr domain n=1 Tax=Tranquillimonas alkanivorans TaxID=441119 RepID=A0A1I5LHY2_9RHOB|nr:Smr/MutS family protein [Tranquillimonas alkanivorans]SFO96918.1 DNA-nicking endonuclease, Smr domain [Tranquillimonas alkanivorans]